MSSPRGSGATSELSGRLTRRLPLVAAALLALLAAGDDLGGAPTKPLSEFHFVRMLIDRDQRIQIPGIRVADVRARTRKTASRRLARHRTTTTAGGWSFTWILGDAWITGF